MRQRAIRFASIFSLAGLAFASPVLASGEDAGIDAASREATSSEAALHWAFAPMRPHDAPAVADPSQVRNAVDAFVVARLEAEGLRLQPENERSVLARRLAFDLVGLPPRPEDVAAFVEDREPEAVEKLVDRLLSTPGHGERWAQHWLDLARFAETDGFEHDHVRPHAWRYRDWVVESFDFDLPYDEMVRRQIAGDEIRPGDPGALIATGFLLAGPDMPDINLLEERRHMVLGETTATVGAVFLGLQIGCAQCHDHKYDPITIDEFYRLRACFEPALTFRDIALPPAPRSSDEETPASGKKSAAGKARALQETLEGEAPVAYVYERGDFRRPGARITPGFPAAINASGDEIPPPADDATSSGRRRALARWLTRRDHPLTARVLVNRVWMHHFGAGIVATPSDFGHAGARPSHPELLDRLAFDFANEGWGMKRLHRRLLLSATYRQGSVRPDPDRGGASAAAAAFDRALALDPENRLLARANRRRLEGETLRDTLLALAGTLDRTRGGPGVYPPLPKEIRATLLKGQWPETADLASTARRSVYVFARRNLRYPFFELFDRPPADASCARRTRSTTAPQALTLLHSELVTDCASRFATKVLDSVAGDLDRAVESAYRLALARSPDEEERRLAREFLRDAKASLARGRDGEQDEASIGASESNEAAHTLGAFTEFALVLMNLSEFLTVD